MEIQAGASGDEAEQDEDERFYTEHRDELLSALRGGCGFSGGEMFNRLEQRGDGGVGIANQGATCYMNSLLQVLFHTPDFRSAIYSFSHDAARHGDEARCIPLQLQRLFARMQLSRARAVSTTGLTDACGMSGHTNEQHDVQELCRVLFDALGRSSVPLRKDIERLYEGRLVQYVRTREPHDGRTYESSRKESVLDLQVPIVGCRTLEEALRKLVEPEELTGDNQWQCDELGTKVDALKGLEFESLPQILHLQLMRFIFDFQSMRRKKLTDNLSIPLELDARCLVGPGAEPAMYQLSGMCVQFGTAGGGHYVAKVRDAVTGNWLDANDAHVGVLTQQQVAGLFRPRGPAAGEAADRGPQVVALDSTDAYYLVYRRVAREAQPLHGVPGALAAEIAEENVRLEVLQRAYALHRELWEVRAFAPSAAELALRRHVAEALHGLLAEGQPCEAGEPQSVVVSLPGSRRLATVLRRVLAALAYRGASEAGLAWAASVGAPGGPAARLRRYDAKRGSVLEPLDGALPLKECCKDGASSARAALILEVAGPGEPFEAWEECAQPFVVCRWRPGGASVSPGDLRVLRLTPERPTAVGGARGAPSVALAAPVAAEQGEAPTFDPCSDELPDLFGDCGDAAPAQPAEMAAISVGELRAGAAAAWGLADAVLVPLTGAAAGQALTADGLSLSELGVSIGDVICVEEVAAGQEPQSVAAYDRVKNSTTLSFNHPDRPSFSEEHRLSVAKTATLVELKALLAAEVRLDPAALHLRREQDGPQMKDESRTIAELGLGDRGSVFVGHGAPCPVDRTLLAVHVYPATGGGAAARGRAADFHHAARGPDPVASFRREVAAPLLEWARGVAGGGGGERPEPRVPLEGLGWRRLRIRDVKAGGNDAILRDEKALSSALPGLCDGRQVGVEVLDHDEELQPSEVVVLLRAWQVSAGCLLPPSEVVASKLQSLGEFRRLLESRFAELAGAVQGASEASVEMPPEDGVAPDKVEVALLPRQPGTMGPKHCAVLKWSDERLNPTTEEALARPLGDLKEIRDGAVLVLRSHLDASRAAAAAPQQPEAGGKAGRGRGKGPSAPPARAKGFSSVEEGAAAVSARAARAPPESRGQERGVHIEVACPAVEEDAERGAGAAA